MACVEVPSEVVLRKTKMCKFFTKGTCEKGDACKFAHNPSHLQSQPDLYKTNLCIAFERNGACRDGSSCKYAHGMQELRAKASQDGDAALPTSVQPQAVGPKQQFHLANHMASINSKLPVGMCAVPAFAPVVAVGMLPNQVGEKVNAPSLKYLPVVFHVLAGNAQMQLATVKMRSGHGAMFESESCPSRQITSCSTMFEVESSLSRQITPGSILAESESCPDRQITSCSTMFDSESCLSRQITSRSTMFESESCPSHQVTTSSSMFKLEPCLAGKLTSNLFTFDMQSGTRPNSRQTTTCSSTRSHSVDSSQTKGSTPSLEMTKPTTKKSKFVSNQSTSTDSTSTPSESVAVTGLRKTKLCRYHARGLCSMGEACNFAHDELVLQTKPNLFRSQLCFAFERKGICKEGAQCKYAHGIEQLRTFSGGEEKSDISNSAKHSDCTEQMEMPPMPPHTEMLEPRLSPLSRRCAMAKTTSINLVVEAETIVKNTFIEFVEPEPTSQRRSSKCKTWSCYELIV